MILTPDQRVRVFISSTLGELAEERAAARRAVRRQVRNHDRPVDMFWAVRLGAGQDNLLAAWSWAIDTGRVDTAFAILAGFAPARSGTVTLYCSPAKRP